MIFEIQLQTRTLYATVDERNAPDTLRILDDQNALVATITVTPTAVTAALAAGVPTSTAPPPPPPQ